MGCEVITLREIQGEIRGQSFFKTPKTTHGFHSPVDRVIDSSHSCALTFIRGSPGIKEF